MFTDPARISGFLKAAAPVLAGIGVFALCEALTGVETGGLSTIGCAAAAGAVQGALGYQLDTPASDRSLGGLAASAGIGAGLSAATAGAFQGLGALATRFAAEDAASAAGTGPVSRALVKYEPYPPAETSPRGFLGGWSTEETLQPGRVISRYGGERGVFASPAGTPFSARGLPPEVELQGENLYEVAQPIRVRAGIAAPWLGSGGGIQYELPGTVRWLLENGFLKGRQP